jgi:carboxylesterase
VATWSQEGKSFVCGEGEHAILFLHGFSSSPRELSFLAQKMAKNGFFCSVPALPGHSGDLDEFTNTPWEEYLDFSLKCFIALRDKHKTVSIVGLSFGGSLALHIAKSQEVRRLVLLAPFLHPAHPKKWGIPIETLVEKLPQSMPNISKGEPGIAEPFARSQHLCYSEYSLGALKSFFHCVDYCAKGLENIQCPVFLLHSLQDHTSAFANSVEILQKISSRIKLLRAFDRSDHILTLDYDREEVEQACINWLKHDF